MLILSIIGVILGLSAELPFGGWLQVPILAILWSQLRFDQPFSSHTALLRGYIFGLAYFVIGLWWIYISLHDVGGMSILLSTFSIFALASFMAIYFALANFIIHYISKKFTANHFIGLFLAAAWVLAEYLRGQLFTGFPWMSLAENQINGPFAGLAPYLGGLGCTFFVVLASWQLLLLFKSKIQIKNGLTQLIVLFLLLLVPQLLELHRFTKPYGDPLDVKLIQGNFPISLELNREAVLKQILFYRDVLMNEKADLIIAPETAFIWPENQLPIDLINHLQKSTSEENRHLLFGVIGNSKDPNGMPAFSNRALGLKNNSPIYIYDKSHLVPFGEYIPPGFKWFVDAFQVPMSNFADGSEKQSPFVIQKNNSPAVSAALTICYEDIFGNELAKRIRHSEKNVHLLINLTNLAWFGTSQASNQQLRASQLRTLETGLPSLRATNTGITAIINADGSIAKRLPEFIQGVLDGQVQPYIGKTLYVLWGDLPIVGLSTLVLCFGLLRKRPAK